MRPSTEPPDPRCWFCHEPIPLYGYDRAYHNATIDGAGVAVCGSDCPEAPEGLIYLGPVDTRVSDPITSPSNPRV